MKLILYSVKIELANKSLLLFHFIILTIVSYVVFQYYGAYNGMLHDEIVDNEYKINVSLAGSPLLEQVKECTEVYGFIYGIIYADEPIDLCNGNIYHCCSIIGEPNFELRIDGNELNNESIYIPYSLSVLNNIKTGDYLCFNNKKYKIAGISSLTDNTLILPIESLLDGYTVSNFNLSFNSLILSDEDYYSSLSSLQQIFGTNAKVYSDIYNEVFGERLKARKFEALLLFLLGTICIIFIYSYILSSRIKRYSICSMCGASRKDIITTIAIGSCIVFSVSFFSAAFIGKIINKLLFEPIWGYNTYDLKLNDYLLFYIIMFFIYTIITVVYSSNFVKYSSVTIYKRYE